MGNGIRVLKFATIGMGVLILLGTAVLLGTIFKRSGSGPVLAPIASLDATLDEPADTTIVGMATVRDKLVVHLRGGGPDRIVLIDPATGEAVGKVSLKRQ